MKHGTSAAGHLAAFLTITIWGTTYIATKILLKDFSPYEILFIRFIIGYFALLLIRPHSLKTRCVREELLFIAAGFCGVTMYFLLENVALTYTLASNAGVIVSASPFFTAVIAHFFLKEERLRPHFFLSFAIAILGIALITFNGCFNLKLNPKGDLLVLTACIFWAVYSVLMRKISVLGYHNVSCTRRIFFYGLLFMIPFLFRAGFHPVPSHFAEPANLFNILFLGLGASALCFVTWNWSVGVLGPVKTSAYIYLVPVITLVVSFLVLHENITPAALLGTFLTLTGLFLSERGLGKGKQYKQDVKAT